MQGAGFSETSVLQDYTTSYFRSLGTVDDLEDDGSDGKVILKWISVKARVRMCTG